MDHNVEELAGMAARRIATAKLKASGLSWSQSRKQGNMAKADEPLKAAIRAALAQGIEPKQAIHDVVTKIIGQRHKSPDTNI